MRNLKKLLRDQPAYTWHRLASHPDLNTPIYKG